MSRDAFTFDKARNVYICPVGKLLHTTGYVHDGTTLLYRARVSDCGPCPLKPRCCPRHPNAKSRAASMRMPAMSPGRWSALPHLSGHAAIASGSRCYLPISSASCDLADLDCGARAAHKMSSHSGLLRRTFAGLPSSLLGRRRQQSSARRDQCRTSAPPLIKVPPASNGNPAS